MASILPLKFSSCYPASSFQIQLITYNLQLTTYYLLLTTFCLPLAHCSLPIVHCPLLIAHCSLTIAIALHHSPFLLPLLIQQHYLIGQNLGHIFFLSFAVCIIAATKFAFNIKQAAIVNIFFGNASKPFP